MLNIALAGNIQRNRGVTAVKAEPTRLGHRPWQQAQTRSERSSLHQPCSQLCGFDVLTLRAAYQRHSMVCRVPEECPQSLCDLIARCMLEDPALRPSAKELHDALKVRPRAAIAVFWTLANPPDRPL